MRRLIGIAILATVVVGLLAGSVLAGPSGPQAGGQDPQQTQLQDRTCAQTCDPAQDCDGNQIQYRPRTRQNWPNDPVEILLWLLGIE